MKKGLNLEQVKGKNRTLILKLINEEGPISRKDIAERTGLTPASVTQITTNLLSEGVLIETGRDDEKRTTAGRRKVFLDIDPSYLFGVTVNIDPENTTVSVINGKGELSSKRTIKTKKDSECSPEDFLREIKEITDSLLKNLSDKDRRKVKALSVGITGIVDTKTGVSKRAYGVWKESVPLKEILEEYTGLKVYVSNNVDAFSEAELLFGEGRRWDNLFIIKWGPGVGSSIVIDGRIYEGRHKKTAEIGHVIVDPEGKKCACGRRGCLGTKISFQALNKIKRFSAEEFGEVYENSRKKERKEFDEAIDLFSECIVNAGVLIAPNRIVLEGDLLRSETIRSALINNCKKYDSAYDEKRIIFSSLSEKEDYIGPAAVLLSRELFSIASYDG